MIVLDPKQKEVCKFLGCKPGYMVENFSVEQPETLDFKNQNVIKLSTA